MADPIRCIETAMVFCKEYIHNIAEERITREVQRAMTLNPPQMSELKLNEDTSIKIKIYCKSKAGSSIMVTLQFAASSITLKDRREPYLL